MVCTAVAAVVSTLSGFFQRWPDAGIDPKRKFVAVWRALALQRLPPSRETNRLTAIAGKAVGASHLTAAFITCSR